MNFSCSIGSRQIDEIPLEDASSSKQIEPIILVIDKARGLLSKYFISNSANIFDVLERSLVPLLYNFDDVGDENQDP